MKDKKVTRRKFVLTGLGTGFALATQPISRWAIATDDFGLDAGEISIPVGKEKIAAYWAMPKRKNNLPVIIVVHEIFGVHEHIQDVCRRLAKEGFLAIAPNLYQRQGDTSKLKEIDQVKEVVGKVPYDQVMKDLDATVAFLQKNKRANGKKISITGFCWGGRTTWLYAAHNPSLKAGVAWYGPLVGTTPNFPKAAVDVAGDLKVPVLGLYGGKDTHITLEHVAQMEDALKRGRSGGSIIKVYKEAPHGFNADYRETYRKDDAVEAWKNMLIWIKDHGGV